MAVDAVSPAIALDKVLQQRNKQGRKEDIGILLTKLKICISSKNLQKGKQIHANAREIGLDSYIYVANSLVNMYAKCHSMVEARSVFDSIKFPEVVSWNTLILGYAENGEGDAALEMLTRMRSQGFAPNCVTYLAALKACSILERDECLQRGRKLHSEIGLSSDIRIQTTLIYMYAKCGSLAEAYQVFLAVKQPNVASWNTLILGYAENGKGFTALGLLSKMKSQGCAPDAITFVAAIKACTALALENGESGKTECLALGKQLHSEIGHHLNAIVENALIDMYAKCGSMRDARQVFDNMKQPDVVSWTALILGYADNGKGAIALNLYSRMKIQGYTPNAITLVAALKACGLVGALETGCKIHTEIDTSTLCDDPVLVTGLVDFYAKCGSLLEAQNVFDLYCSSRDVTMWTALLAGYSRLGDSGAVFALLERMQDSGVQPNRVTFLSILTCCSHAGLLAKAGEVFEAMSTTHGVTPALEHYSCMVDMLSRHNKLDEAIALLRSMPWRPDAVTWLTVLAACCKWKNVGVGRLAFKSLVSLDGTNAAAYALMAHIYGTWGMWREQEAVLQLRNELETWREPGHSCWLNELHEVHSFLVE